MELTPEARIKRSAYQREWRKKNPDKVIKYQAAYWEKRVLKDPPQQKTLSPRDSDRLA